MTNSSWKDHSKWDRKMLKREGKIAFLQNYTDTLLVSVVYVLFGIGYGSSTLNVADNPSGGQSGQLFLDLVSFQEAYRNIFHEGGFFLYNIWNQFLSYSGPLTDGLRHLNGVFTAKDFASGFFAGLSLLLVIAFTLMFKNILIVGDRRFFLENRVYHKTQLSRLLYVYRQRRFRRVAWAMLVKSVFEILWAFTVVGGIVKFYSYRLVPFILAENPSLGPLEAINLSRAMMDGNKWRWFVLDLTLMPWRLLSGVTFQLAGILYAYGYIRSTQAFLYADLRSKALSFEMIGASLLNDSQLYPAREGHQEGSHAGTHEYYPDYAKNMEKERVEANFGRHYSILHLLLLFFVFAGFGWVWEVSLNLIRDGIFVNRGFLHGPWLPIYGFGGILILLVLKKFRDNVFHTFVAVILLCGVLEYSTSWFMEVTLGKRWWDYSEYLFNINGRVCLEALLFFAVGGCAIVYMIAPRVDNLLHKLKAKGKIPLAVVLVIFFASDYFYTHFNPNEGQGVTSEHLTELSAASAVSAAASTSTSGNRRLI